MTETVPDILARIVAKKRVDLASTRPPLEQWAEQAEQKRNNRRAFRTALEENAPAIIAEIKKASPSKGLLSANFDPAEIARSYEAGGAAALSVLTDQAFFQGSLQDLEMARQATRLPVLRKDFTLEEVHVLEAAAHGADAILLIAAVLREREIRRLREAAARFSMTAIVEVHNRQELDKAAAAGADVIGVNNRDLNTFQVSLETSLALADHIPEGALRISESGIRSAEDLRRLAAAGYSAFLVGEHLMRSGQPAEALRALITG